MSTKLLPPFDEFTTVHDGRATIDPGVSGFLGAFDGYVLTLALRDARRDRRAVPASAVLHQGAAP